MSDTTHTDVPAWLKEFGKIAAALAIALVATVILVLLVSDEPAKALRTLATAPLSSKRTFGLLVDDTAKLTLAGLGFALVFQARQFALGVQGQAYVGGLAAALVALSPLGVTYLSIPLGIIAAMAAGSVLGFIPGWAKARFGASEIVSSLMLNYIAIRTVNYIVRAHLAPEGSGHLMSPKFDPISIYPAIIARTRFDIGIIIALATALVIWFLLYRTRWGLKLRLVGQNDRFAEYAGIEARRVMITSMTLAGAIGGLLGAVFVQGRAFGRIATDFDGLLAFEGIIVSMVVKDRPHLIPIAAFGYGYLR
ncbi:MAG: ABC transporter permease, partial [Pseudomonadota bacterium]